MRVSREEDYERRRLAVLADIARDRARLHDAVQQIERVTIERFDIRRRIADQPWQWVAGAFAVGLLLGLDR